MNSLHLERSGDLRNHEGMKGTKTHEKPKVLFRVLRAFVIKRPRKTEKGQMAKRLTQMVACAG
jgi:hypothetical protein